MSGVFLVGDVEVATGDTGRVGFPPKLVSVGYGGVTMAKPGNKAVSRKIEKLMHEGKPQDQAVAIAKSMQRAGRLTAQGGYRRKGKG